MPVNQRRTGAKFEVGRSPTTASRPANALGGAARLHPDGGTRAWRLALLLRENVREEVGILRERASLVALVEHAAIALGALVLTLGCSGEAVPGNRAIAGVPEEAGVDYPCVADPDVWTIEGVPATGQIQAPRSPEQLIESSPMIVIGTFIEASPLGSAPIEGTTFVAKIFLFMALPDAREMTFQRLWTPLELSSSLDGQLVTGQFVAFLTHEGTSGTGARSVHVDGLWMACNSASPAVRVVPDSIESGWSETADGAMTIEDLMDLVRASTRHPTRYTFGEES